MKRWTMMLSFSAMMACAALLGAAGCGSSTEGGGDCAATTPSSCPSSPPSYKTDVAPILQSRCTSCHSSGGSQPDPLLDTYAGVKAEINEVKNEVAGCEMPPAGSTALTEAEANTILAWIVCGAQDN